MKVSLFIPALISISCIFHIGFKKENKMPLNTVIMPKYMNI